MEENKKFVSIYVSESIAKQIEAMKDNEKIQLEIIKSFFQNEKDWMKDEMADIDEQTLRYKNKLLEIKNNFSEAQNSYISEIEHIQGKAMNALSKIDNFEEKLSARLTSVMGKMDVLKKTVDSFQTWNLDGYLEAINKVQKMTQQEKEIFKILHKDAK